MTGRRTVESRLADAVGALVIDESYLRKVISGLTAIGSSPWGFRTAGTPEDTAVADYVRGEMADIGLFDVAVEPVEVDAWRFLDAGVSTHRTRYRAVSFGGVPGTGPAGITAPLVDVGDGRRDRLDRLDCTGALALLDWRSDTASPAAVAIELGRRGALGLVLNCPAGGPWYQSPGALGGFDGHWPADGPPMVLISAADAVDLRSDLAHTIGTMRLDVESTPRAGGSNVVGYLPGAIPGPIVVGAHHDAWFTGAFDNTSGVAVLLALAKALTEAGTVLRHRICFTSRTGEEYGRADSVYDWCVGAWEQVHTTHPEWATGAPFHLCLEASGHRELRTVLEAPVELAGWARRIGRVADQRGWLPTGWRVAPPVAGTEQWPYLVAGIPGVAAYSWEKSFGRSDYHTQFDTEALLDYAHLTAQARTYALLLLAADEDPDAILDHRARARQLEAIGRRQNHADLRAAAATHDKAHGRKAFQPIGRGHFALDALGRFRYPHEQTAADADHLAAAIAAVDAGDHRAAARTLTAVGSLGLFRYLSQEAFSRHIGRLTPEGIEGSWAAASHLTPDPDLWAQLATLRGEPGARPFGPWLRESLSAALAAARQDLSIRLTAMSRAVTPPSIQSSEAR